MHEAEDSFRETFANVWETLHLRKSGALDLAATIVPSETRGSAPDLAISTLPSLSQELELGPTIGKGGTAIVYLAKQLALHRDVAVKVVRRDQDSPKAMRELLAEGFVTGLLQHPNIIPIYALGRNDDGAPMLVMKCIGGTSWRDYLREPEKHTNTFGAQSALEFHLDVFMQVAKAAHYAHERGIIHRDLKPDNVMIGELGEVYVLDWGLAVATNDGGGRFRAAKEVDAIAGTPGYMAPEMVDYQGQFPISPRTDVFLLGAVLHEILTRRPRNSGTSTFEIMFAAYRAEPQHYEEEVPAELGAIANKACARDPKDRYSSAEELRRAIAEYGRHKGSADLTAEAADRLIRLQALAPKPDADALQIDRAFTEARFGFEQALRVWPENQRAKDGLYAALSAMADRELTRGAVERAEVLLAQLPDAKALHARLVTLKNKKLEEASEVAELKKISAEVDANVGLAARSRFALVLAVAWTILPLVMSYARRSGWVVVTNFEYLMQASMFGAVLLAGVYIGRRAFLKNDHNRRVISAALLVFIGMVLHRSVAWALHIPHPVALTQELFLYAISLGFIAIFADAKIGVSATVYAVAFITSGFYTEYVYEITAIANGIALSAIALLWSRRNTLAVLSLLLFSCAELDTQKGLFRCAGDLDCSEGWRCESAVCTDRAQVPDAAIIPTDCDPPCSAFATCDLERNTCIIDHGNCIETDSSATANGFDAHFIDPPGIGGQLPRDIDRLSAASCYPNGIRLAQAADTGGLWYRLPLVFDRFRLSATIEVQPDETFGLGDGIALIFVEQLRVLGGGGAYLGYDGLTGYALEVDYAASEFGCTPEMEPAAPHLAWIRTTTASLGRACGERLLGAKTLERASGVFEISIEVHPRDAAHAHAVIALDGVTQFEVETPYSAFTGYAGVTAGTGALRAIFTVRRLRFEEL